MAIITNHGNKRMKERIGLNSKSRNKVCNRALSDGISHKETSGSLRRYLDKIYLSYRRSNNTRIYNQKIFIFHNQTLITVLDLPNNFKSQVNKINKQKEG